MTRLPLALLATLLLAACGSDPDADRLDDRIARKVEDASQSAIDRIEAEGQLSRDLPGTERIEIATRDGAMTLGLTSDVIYARLSEQTRSEARSKMKDAASEDGLGGQIARAVTGAVSEGLEMATQIPLSTVRDVRYEGDRLVIETDDGRALESMKTNNRPFLTQFSPADAARFVDAFRAESRP